MVDLPKIAVVIPTNRSTGVNHHMTWETLTHAGMGAIGIKKTASRSLRFRARIKCRRTFFSTQSLTNEKHRLECPAAK
jgi:hypothetical protein